MVAGSYVYPVFLGVAGGPGQWLQRTPARAQDEKAAVYQRLGSKGDTEP